MNTRDDSTDLFGVKCQQDEPLHEAAMRCVVTNVLNLFRILSIGASNKISVFAASVADPFAGLESTQGSYHTD